MDVEKRLEVVDFITEKDLKKSKATKKRKRVGNRIPIGVKAARHHAAQRNPKNKPQPVRDAESDDEESAEGTEL